jgi:hypothetical protein
MAEANQRFSIRIQFETTCTILKFVPHRGEPVPSEVYVRVGGRWKLKAIIPTDVKVQGRSKPSLEEP